MTFGSRRIGRMLVVAGAAAALAAVLPGCSYLQWRREKKEQRAQLEKSPTNLLLEKDYAPQDCFGLIGRIAIPAGQKSPLIQTSLTVTAVVPCVLTQSPPLLSITNPYWKSSGMESFADFQKTVS